MKLLRKQLTVANLLAGLALFMALSGAAYAAKTTLGKKAVKTKNIANAAVTTAKLRNGAVATGKLRNGVVTGPKIAAGAVGATQIANGAVRSAALGGGVVTTGKLKDGGVTAEKLANNGVGTDKLSANAVATGKLQDGAVSAAKLNAGLLAQLVKSVSYVSEVNGAPSDTSPQSVTAECPAGKQAVGGGIRVVEGDATVVQVTESLPFVAGDGKRSGWTASAKTSESGKTFAVQAYAVCAEF